MKQLEKELDELDELWETYTKRVYEVVEYYFTEYVEPFCKKRNLQFIAGMGTWSMLTKNGRAIYPEEHPNKKFQEITNILEKSIDGFSDNNLGSLMPDFPRKEETK